MASCVTVVSTTSNSSKTFQQQKSQSTSSQVFNNLVSVSAINKESDVSSSGSHTSAAPASRPNFLAEMQSAQQRRRLSKDSSSEGGNSVCSPTKSSSKDVPIRESAAVQSSNPDSQNSSRSNVFSNSLADQLKVRLEERRRNSDDNDIQDLAADVQKAVNIANESSKSI